MNTDKQHLMIEYMLSSPDTFAICNNIVDPDYFDPQYRNAVRFIKEYYKEFSTTPDSEQMKAETSLSFSIKEEISIDQIEYTTSQIEKFCKHRAMESAVLGASELIANGDFGAVESRVRDALMISLHNDLGLRYFDDPEERLRRMMEENHTCPTLWSEVDELLFGGISRKELLLVAANSGGGKSITLTNLGFNFLAQKKNVLYISLELSEDIVAQRFDTMYTGVSRKDWKEKTTEILTGLSIAKEECGILDIIQLTSGTNSNKIESYLKEYFLFHKMMPDLLIVDYLDKMSPNEKVDAGDVFTKDKLCSEQIRDLGVRYNMYVATASQLNRSAVGATAHDHSQIAGGISKINEADVYWSIIMTEPMRAAGEMTFKFQKTRNSDGVGNEVHMKFDSSNLRITDKDKTGLKFVPKSPGANNSKSLSDLIDM